MMFKLIGISAALAALTLTACGGGGGSGGENTLPYSISLRAEKTQLPLNPSHYPAGLGVYAPFTTTLYVSARQGGMPIPGGEDIFACNLERGLDSGSLYYLDGDDEHEDEDGNPLSYRSVTLGANSGGNSFHFHAGDKAGTARVTCSVTDPRDGRVYAASEDIVVGGVTNKPSSVLTVTQAPGYLGAQNNSVGLPNSVVVQARVFDDLNQPVPNSAGANVSVRILPVAGSVFSGARLMAGVQSRGVNEDLWVATVGGVGSFMVASGPDRTGSIVLEVTVDRADNDVTNGIAQPIRSLRTIDVVNGIAATPLAVAGTTVGATVGVDFAYALSAIGGVPPYKWSAVGAPAGLGVTADGVVIGRPTTAGTSSMVVTVTDANNTSAVINIPVTVTAAAE